MLRFFQLFQVYFRLNTLNELQYRANLTMQLIGSFINLGFAWLSLALIFSYTDTLSGWSPVELAVVVGVYTLISGFINTFIQPNMARMMEGIQEGTLDYTLIKPEDGQLLISMTQFQIWKLVDVLLGILVLFIAVPRLEGVVGLVQAALFLLVLFCGTIIVYCFWLMLSSISFWFVRIDEILMLYDSVYQTGRYPIRIYPRWMQMGLTFIVPVAFAVTVPAEALTNRLDWQTSLMVTGLTLLVVILSRLIWKAGLRRYSGASS
jgi:ABC-2 type transport system permease protein